MGIGAAVGAGAGALAVRHAIGAAPGALIGGLVGGSISDARAQHSNEYQVKKIRAERGIIQHLKRNKNDMITIRNGKIEIRKDAMVRRRVKRIDGGERSKYRGSL
jgi:hypothetical protein